MCYYEVLVVLVFSYSLGEVLGIVWVCVYLGSSYAMIDSFCYYCCKMHEKPIEGL